MHHCQSLKQPRVQISLDRIDYFIISSQFVSVCHFSFADISAEFIGIVFSMKLPPEWINEWTKKPRHCSAKKTLLFTYICTYIYHPQTRSLLLHCLSWAAKSVFSPLFLSQLSVISVAACFAVAIYRDISDINLSKDKLIGCGKGLI